MGSSCTLAFMCTAATGNRAADWKHACLRWALDRKWARVQTRLECLKRGASSIEWRKVPTEQKARFRKFVTKSLSAVQECCIGKEEFECEVILLAETTIKTRKAMMKNESGYSWKRGWELYHNLLSTKLFPLKLPWGRKCALFQSIPLNNFNVLPSNDMCNVFMWL